MRPSNAWRILCAPLLVVFTLASHTYAQIDTVWIRNWSAMTDFQVSSSGDVYVVGPTGSPKDVLTARFNADNSFAWSRLYDHQGQRLEDLPHGLFLDAYENVYVVGGVHDSATLVDGITIKYDPTGTLRWARTTDPGDSTNQFFGDAVCDPLGYVSLAQAAGDPGTWTVMFNCKLDPNGNRVWSDVDSTVNEVFYRMGQIATDKSQNTFILGQLHATGNWTLLKYSPGGSRAWQNSNLGSSTGGKLCVDNSGNVYALFYAPGVIKKIDKNGGLAWARNLDVTERYTIAVDMEQNVIVSGGTTGSLTGPYFTAKYDPTGNEMWHSNHGGHLLALDRKGNIYVQDNAATLRLIDPRDGALVWKDTLAIAGPHKLDYRGNIYVRSTYRLAKYKQDKVFVIRDAHRDTIANTRFQLIRISNPPLMSEDTLGIFMTDSLGRFSLKIVDLDTLVFEADSLNVSTDTLIATDTIKIATWVRSDPSFRHPGMAGTLCSITLDNMQMDHNGDVSFNTAQEGDIILDHTEYRYNLLVSVEWDAAEAYLQGLESEFRYMSNYLYDVSDGQIRLDTVMIYDDKVNSYWADIRILASNTFVPHTIFGALNNPSFDPIRMPRKWFRNRDQGSIQSYFLHPLSQAMPDNYCTMAHEFGHYALGFWDEYDFLSPQGAMLPAAARYRPLPPGNYGFMDYAYISTGGGGSYASEMSSEYRYDMPECQNTEQWVFCHSLSCWDYLESRAEQTINGLPVPIRKPHHTDTLEHVTAGGMDYLPGPNSNLDQPDYDVGRLVRFTEAVTPPSGNIKTLHLDVQGVPRGGINVILRKNLPGGSLRDIDQGQTTDAGGIFVLGADPLQDVILAAGHGYVASVAPMTASTASDVHRSWLHAVAVPGDGQTSGDSAEMLLGEVRGDYPWVAGAELLQDGWHCRLLTAGPLPETPTVDAITDNGQPYVTSFTYTGSGYLAALPDTLSKGGTALIWAVDDSSHTFFVSTPYEWTEIDSVSQMQRLPGPGNLAEAHLDSANSGVQKVLWLSSSYPVPMTGLEAKAIQAGEAHTLATYPVSSVTGVNWIRISYPESDMWLGDSLIGEESLLKIYRWEDNGNSWQCVGGVVDTARNEVTAEINSVGTYALFTTQSPVGVEDDPESTLPCRFELSQNYPNPFNPVTTIEYSLPTRSEVTIEVFNVLGRRIRTLVNETQSAGSHRIDWTGTDDAGKPVSTGLYLYRLQVGDVVQTRKMLLLK